MARHYKFPDVNDYGAKHQAVLCPGDRVIELYTQSNPKPAQRISNAVKTWFTSEAHKQGWAGVRFLPQVQTQHSAGAILWQPPKAVSVQITVTEQTLVMIDSVDAEEVEDQPEPDEAEGEERKAT
jgi:hypothetical protein